MIYWHYILLTTFTLFRISFINLTLFLKYSIPRINNNIILKIILTKYKYLYHQFLVLVLYIFKY